MIVRRVKGLLIIKHAFFIPLVFLFLFHTEMLKHMLVCRVIRATMSQRWIQSTRSKNPVSKNLLNPFGYEYNPNAEM